MATNKTWFGRSRVFWAIVGIIVFSLGTLRLFGVQTISYAEMHKYSKKFAVLNLTPQPLPTQAVSTSPTLKLANRGYSFQGPWTDLDLTQSKFLGSWAVFAFRSHSTVIFCVPAAGSDDLRATVMKAVGGSAPLERLVGAEAMKSDYSFHRTLLTVTTKDLTPWMSQRDSVRASMLLMFKATSSIGGNTGLFQVDSNGWKGFQFDDPAKNSKTVTLELYDAQGRHVEIEFTPNRSSGVGLTQQEINRVIQSLSSESASR